MRRPTRAWYRRVLASRRAGPHDTHVNEMSVDDIEERQALEARRDSRRARLRRDRARARAQLIVLVSVPLVALLAFAGWAYATRDTSPHSPAELGAVPVRGVAESVAATAPVDSLRTYLVELARSLEPTVPPLVPAPGERVILLDKSAQLVSLYEADGKAVDRFPCASGHTYPRVGEYRVNGHKPQSMFLGDRSTFKHFVIFTKADTGTNVGFHSIPHDGSGNDVGGLGTPESHGCVRLADDRAAFLYGWAKNGTKVVVVK
jgi:hypothetical protein